jgi:hypothetical protein
MLTLITFATIIILWIALLCIATGVLDRLVRVAPSARMSPVLTSERAAAPS